MKIYYSKTTNGFYPKSMKADYEKTGTWPIDAVEITAEEHASMIEGQNQGKVIAADSDGFPVLQDPPKPTEEQLQARINTEARTYLASTDWYVIRWQENGTPIPEDITTTRTEARANIIEV